MRVARPAYRTVDAHRAANDRVSIGAAQNLWHSDVPVDWPVSGDDTAIGFGPIIRRRVSGLAAADLWAQPGVNA